MRFTSSTFLQGVVVVVTVTVSSVVHVVTGQTDPTSQCTLCENGQTPDPNPTTIFFPGSGTNCTALITKFETNGTNELLQNDTDCKDTQLLAFQIGCCNNPPPNYCTMCENGEPFKGGNTVPLGTASDPTCSAFQFDKIANVGVFEAGTCDDTQLRRAGFYCDCPNVEQECSLCPDGSPPGNPSRGDKFASFSNCRSLEYFYSIFKKDECEDITFNFGVDLGAFCKCPNTEANNTCTLCPNGDDIIQERSFKYKGEDGPSCGEAYDFAQFIVRPSFCDDWYVEPRAACCAASGATGLLLGFGILASIMMTTFSNLF